MTKPTSTRAMAGQNLIVAWEEALPRSTDNLVCRPNAMCPYSALLTSRMRGAEGSIRLR